jgi:hypothetical protein
MPANNTPSFGSLTQYAGPKFIKQVTVDAHNCTGGHPYDSFEFSANHTTLENMLLGECRSMGNAYSSYLDSALGGRFPKTYRRTRRG